MREFSKIPSFSDLKCVEDKNTDSLTFDTSAAGFSPSQIDVLMYLPAQTVVHELAHLFAPNKVINHITDCYYGAFAAEYMGIGLSDAATGNADSESPSSSAIF